MIRFALLSLCLAACASADIVRTKDGKTIEGKILEENDKELVIEVQRGKNKAKMKVARENVASIEKIRTPQEEYEERKSKLSESDAAGHIDLAQWCLSKEMPSEGVALLLIVMNHGKGEELTTARRLLNKQGWREFPGAGWKAEEAHWGEMGFAKLGGRWVTKEFQKASADCDRLKKELDAVRKRGAYQAGEAGDRQEEYDKLKSQHDWLEERKKEMDQEYKEACKAAIQALKDLGHKVLPAESELVDVYKDNYGSWKTKSGLTLLTRDNEAQGKEFRTQLAKLKANRKEDEGNEKKAGDLRMKMDAILIEAKKTGSRAESSEEAAKRLEEELASAENHRAEAEGRMKDRIGKDGLPKE